MKILVITTLYPGDSRISVRDVSHAVHGLIQALPSHQVKVKKVIRPVTLFEWKRLRYGSILKRENINGITVETKSFFNLPVKGVYPLGADCQYLENSVEGVDLVVAHMARGMVIANDIFKRFNVPFICVAHASDLSWCKKFKEIFNNARAVYARSMPMKKRIEELGIKVDGVVFSGIESELITTKKALGYTSGSVLNIVTVCNLQSLKNIDIVLRALVSLPVHMKWKYTIVGDGAEYDNIQENIIRLGLSSKVTMLGHKDRDYCLSTMRDSDVFVMPSAPETLGLVYLEAMASGCIVIGSKGWGIDGIVVHGKNGYLVEPRSIPELVQTFEAIFDQDQTPVLSNSMETIQHYTRDSAINNYIACLKSD